MPAAHSPLPDRTAILLAGVVLLAASIVAFAAEASPEWARTREDVRGIVGARVGEARAARVPTGLEQVWIADLHRVDRCVACHATIEGGADLLAAPNPARSHPNPALLAAHPVETFGCTLCHGGQGAATTKAAAHGEVDFWDEPLLGSRRAKRYGLTPAELMESNCNVCHRRDESTVGMPLINEAKALVQSERGGCIGCHRLEAGSEEGGTKGPDLSREGEKPPEHLVFPAGWDGARTTLEWHAQHFMNPKAVVPGSRMRKIEMTEREAKGLALLVMSWKTRPLPPAWTPAPSKPVPPK